MKGNGQYLTAAVLACALMTALIACNSTPPPQQQTATQAQGQQVPIPTTAAEVSGPAPGNKMTKEYVQMVGRMAYFWGWPLVANANRAVAFSKVPEPGLVGGVVPIAYGGIAMLTDYVTPNQRVIACANQDVVYGPGFLPLDKEPFVIQIPEFGDRFWVFALYDARTDEFSKLGKPYGTKPGFYLVVASNWKGSVPDGITAVVRSSTDLVFSIPRMFKDDTAQDTQCRPAAD